MDLEVSGELWFWKGPAPWHFVTVPEDDCLAIADVADIASYGWGCIPVTASIGDTEFRTSLIPKDGGYLVPVKADVRKRQSIELGDAVHVRLVIDV